MRDDRHAWIYYGGAKQSFSGETRRTEFYGELQKGEASILRHKDGKIKRNSQAVSFIEPASSGPDFGEPIFRTLQQHDFDTTFMFLHEPSTVLGGTVDNPPLTIFFNQAAGEEFTDRISDTALFFGRAPPENGVIVDKKKWGTSVYTAHVTS
jgi:hypothetical protein